MSNRSLFTFPFKLVVILLYFHATAFTQTEGKFPPIFNEFAVSANTFTIYNNEAGYENRLGFGVGMYHVWFEQNRVNLLFGFVYNNYFLYRKEGSIFSDPPNLYLTDIKYHFQNLSLPVVARFNIGKSRIFFTELGLYAIFNFRETVKGFQDSKSIKHTFKPPELFFEGGGIAGLGAKIPLKKNGLIVKAYYCHSIFNYGVVNLSFGYRIIK